LKLKLLFGIILLEKNMAKIKKDFNFNKEINNSNISEKFLNEDLLNAEYKKVYKSKQRFFSNSKSKLTIVDLFSGCGGLSEGFCNTGKFTTLGALDIDENAASTYKFNFPKAKVLIGDITQVKNPEDLFGEVDVIIGGPPCQGFSALNRHNKKLEDDPRNLLFFEFLRFVKTLKPKAILIENVRQILTQKDGFAKNKIIELLTELGYNVTSTVLDASDFGVPQKRKRAFFIGVKDGYGILQKNGIEKFKVTKKVNVFQSIGDLYSLENRVNRETDYYELAINDKAIMVYNHRIRYPNKNVIEKISYVSQGGNWKQVPSHLFPNQRTNRHSNYLKRLNEEGLSITIDTGHDVYFHPKFDRVPTVRESARLQSFNDDFVFLGNHTSQLRQVGNAVPPLMAESLAKYIYEVIKNGI
jgi:DNA (cytosine-5)-methyltransferase 1